MYFTLVFEKDNFAAEIYELVYHPSPIWLNRQKYSDQTIGEMEVNINTQRGITSLFEPLMKTMEIDPNFSSLYISADRKRKATLICHETGYGTEQDLKLLKNEIRDAGLI